MDNVHVINILLLKIFNSLWQYCYAIFHMFLFNWFLQSKERFLVVLWLTALWSDMRPEFIFGYSYNHSSQQQQWQGSIGLLPSTWEVHFHTHTHQFESVSFSSVHSWIISFLFLFLEICFLGGRATCQRIYETFVTLHLFHQL